MAHRLSGQVGGVRRGGRGVDVAGRRRALFVCILYTYWLLCSSKTHDIALHGAEVNFSYNIEAIVSGLSGACHGPPLEDASKASSREWNRWRWFFSTDPLFRLTVFLHNIDNA